MEAITIDEKSLDTCLKIEIRLVWPKWGSDDLSYVWLKKGVGVVKWQRTTGRIDEMME